MQGVDFNEVIEELKQWAKEVNAEDFLIPEFYEWLNEWVRQHPIQHPSTLKYLFAVWLYCYDAISTRVAIKHWGLNLRLFYKWLRRICPHKIAVVDTDATSTEEEEFF